MSIFVNRFTNPQNI